MEKWRPWQLQSLGFLLPWWLIALPFVAEALLDGGRFLLPLPLPVRSVPFFIPLLVAVAAAVLLRLWSRSHVVQNVAAWFLFGVVCTPFFVTFTILVVQLLG